MPDRVAPTALKWNTLPTLREHGTSAFSLQVGLGVAGRYQLGLYAGKAEFPLHAAGGALADEVGDLAEQSGNAFGFDQKGFRMARRTRLGILVGGEQGGSGLIIHVLGMRQDLQASLGRLHL